MHGIRNFRKDARTINLSSKKKERLYQKKTIFYHAHFCVPQFLRK